MPVSARGPTCIGLLLFPEFSMMALASATEPLRAANRLAGAERYRWELLSRDGAAVTSSSGMELVTRRLEDPGLALDYLFVVASLGIETLRDVLVHHQLQRLAAHGLPLGALSTGTFVLARAGLLEGYRCTLHWESLRQFAEEFLHSRIRGPQEQQRMAIQWRYGVPSEVHEPRGEPDAPLPAQEMFAKYHALATPVLGVAATGTVSAAVAELWEPAEAALGALKSVLLAPGARPRACS